MSRSFTGYPGIVWSTCYQTLLYLNGLISTGSTGSDIAGPAALVFQTLRNGSSAVEAWQAGAALTLETQNLAAVQALSFSIPPVEVDYFNARIAAVEAAAVGISTIPPKMNPFNAMMSIQNGSVAIPYTGYLEWCMNFTGETPPAGLTPASLVADAALAATTWLDVAQAIMVLQGTNPTSTYDTATRQYRCSTTIATILSQLQSGPFASNDNVSALWNGSVALPTILLDGASLATSPASLQAQQCMVIRYVLDTTATAIATFLYSLRTSLNSVPVTAILSNNDTLLDLAARETGDFNQWTAIAAANALKPPYPGPTNQAIALSGRQLYMPGSGVQIGPTESPPSYPNDALGTDYLFGPINGKQPPWMGDIPLITGLLNFAMALGRRIQTPIGSLTYHQEYGSRIPGEVGAVQSGDEAARLAAFGKAALAADRRTGRVLLATASVEPGQLATFNGVVNPIGPALNPVQIHTVVTTPGAPF
jgi:hypothetical protein